MLYLTRIAKSGRVMIYHYFNIDTSPNTLPKDTTKTYQEGLHLLSGASQATGGKFSVTKTKWYLLEFKWDKAGKWRLYDNEADIFLQNPSGPQKIE